MRAGGRRCSRCPRCPTIPGKGAIAALEKACAALGLSLAAFLGDCAFFLHGSTVATNTLLEGKGGRVGLLITAGFRDSLEARRGLRKDPWDHRTPYPPVLVPRYLRLPVRGRIGADGGEIEPIDLDDVRAAIEVFREAGMSPRRLAGDLDGAESEVRSMSISDNATGTATMDRAMRVFGQLP